MVSTGVRRRPTLARAGAVLAAACLAAAGCTADSSEPAEEIDWSTRVQACPNPGQPVIVQHVATGDVDGDREPDTVVARTCEPSTSYWPSTVEVFGSAEDKRRRLGVLLEDVGATDRPWVTKVAVDNGTVVVEAYGVDETSEGNCADLNFTYRFRYAAGAFTREARDVGNANKCQPVG
ncbi:hypothetical protein [Jidongwangia harbinensis]|uniref:hypothetical protein n=1 Tax=Jidongwangia harbinensis TaxID=2878561 RepID=UPI001CD92BC2|nr:hypothetical protein [Jidongwangia harbinensis]MCA2218209.1 hypothetical protein [Jidongwangia harbinensis]